MQQPYRDTDGCELRICTRGETAMNLMWMRRGFRSRRPAKAILSGIETIQTIKRGRVYDKQPGVQGEVLFTEKRFLKAT